MSARNNKRAKEKSVPKNRALEQVDRSLRNLRVTVAESNKSRNAMVNRRVKAGLIPAGKSHLDNVLLHDEDTITFGNEDAASFLNEMTDPFGAEKIVPIPDGDARRVFIMTLRGRATYAMGTNPDGTHAATAGGFIMLHGLCGAATTSTQSVIVSYGADPNDSSATQLYYKLHGDSITTALSIVSPSNSTFRRIGCAIRVTGTGVETESGSFMGGNTPSGLMYDTTHFTGNTAFTDTNDLKEYPIKDGITVRSTCPSPYHWPEIGVGGGSLTMSAAPNSVPMWGDCPFIKFYNLSSTTTLQIEWVHYYEAEPIIRLSAALMVPAYVKDFSQIIYAANRMPYTTKGHTFKQAVNWVGRAVRNTGNYLWANVLKRPMRRLGRRVEGKLDAAVDSL